ncbi:hypothetical protein D9758_001596 [Tetrapyrgos nigripes]|uniref:F-box domain-containing protein n=1 Tax=Tetrapyrgos nigripes TaxID=182062 RepID=A0A8H5LWV5_9AGAR|nr:hypothetical protein D9758_001596 [Tetrapyrgos nigripes]
MEPSGQNEHNILGFCSEASADIERMNAQISRLQSSLVIITQKRDALRSKVSSLRSSYALLLPTELWQQVFAYCVDVFPVISTSSTNLAPIQLTHVCRRWRSIVLDTPDLWSSMHIVIPKPTSFRRESKCEGIRAAVKYFLKRSRDAPLSISLKARDYSGHAPGHSPEEVKKILACLLPHSKRWRHLKFRMPFSWLTEATSGLTSEDLLCLETVLMDDGYPPFLMGAPKLHQLSLEVSGMQTISSVNSEEWRKIQVLKLFWRHFELDDLFTVLARSTGLRACMVQLLFPSAVNPHPSTETIVLPHLEKLCLTANSGNNLKRIFDQLSLANLQELYIREHSSLVELTRSLATSLQGFFQRSSCSITKLEIMIARSPKLTLDELCQFFCSLSTLEELVIVENMHDDPFMDEQLLRAFTVTSPMTDVLCPKLKRMRLSDRFSFTEETLLEFVQARMNPLVMLPPSSPTEPQPLSPSQSSHRNVVGIGVRPLLGFVRARTKSWVRSQRQSQSPPQSQSESSTGPNLNVEDLTPVEHVFVRTPRPKFVSYFEKLDLKGVEVVMDSVARFSMLSRNAGPSSREIAIP